MAGTQTIDKVWRDLKEDIPGAISARTEEGRDMMASYIRAAQWKQMVSTADRWPAFCAAMKKHGAAESDRCAAFGNMPLLGDE
eukprot:3704729-Alexandrium_andersonii.AAC.1